MLSFVEEVTKTILESGLLKETTECYAFAGPLPAFAIPTSLQDALMARLDRLGSAKGLAQLGAMLGRQFAYALLREVAPHDEASLQSELGRLVEAALLYQRGQPPHASYRFKHTLIQEAAYQSLLRRTRQQYHQRIAQVLEAQFPDTAKTQPEVLAHHYTEAGCKEQAVSYWQRAGQQALQRSAHLEAVRHLTTALALLAPLPDTAAGAQQELDLQIALGAALIVTKGPAAPEAEQTFARARALCQAVGASPQLFPTLRGLWQFYLTRGELLTARELGEQLYELARRVTTPTHRLIAHEALGVTLFYLGDYAAARLHLEHGIALSEPAAQRALALPQGVAPGVRCLSLTAHTLWCLGFPAQAIRRHQEAVALAQALAHPYSLAHTQVSAGGLHQRRREASAVQALADTQLALATAQGFLSIGLGAVGRGWALAMQGQGEAGLAQLHQGLTAVVATGQTLAQPYCLLSLAEAAGHTGQTAEGLRRLDEALTVLETTTQGDGLAEASRLRGVLLLCQTIPDAAQAEACFQQALAIAARQHAKSLELRAAMSLSRLWQQQGKQADARALLAPVYGWFTEGFDTADLQDAKALLQALGG